MSMDFDKVQTLHMGAARCAVDLGDGSERGEYVNQDYILNKLGRPHRAISLMYCYYPLDEGWPGRVSVVHANPNVSFAWDYPYDDYFTYKGGLGGSTELEPFPYMREIRAHGQDVNLTLTIDPHVTDEQLIAIAKDLRTFGRMFLRINHEATGDWFSFTKRCSYQEIADFYVRFHRIIKEYAPNVQTILCIGGVEKKDGVEIEMEKEFADAVRATDIWSVDKYLALHWGWPYDVAEPGGTSHTRYVVDDVLDMTRRSRERYKFLCDGKEKPMLMSELNADGDVTGAYEQAEMVKYFCDQLKNEPATWFSGFTMYQFRDRGRLGLEIEDPSNPENGFEQPLMSVYKEIIHDPYFSPSMTVGDAVTLPITLRWGNSEDADGLALPLVFEKDPVFCELTFEEPLNLMLEINGKWFYKAPGAKTIDLMPAFYENRLKGKTELTLKLFAPPASGENDPAQGADWQENYYTTMTKLPQLRVRYEAVMKK